MKNILILLVFFTCISAFAQEADTTYWRRAFKGSVTFNQASFSDNWTGGDFKANYLKEKNSWDNEIDLVYGYINNQGTGYRKNNDRIYLDTKYGRALSEKWNLFASLNILTQFANGFKYDKDSLDREVALKVSEFMAPGYFTAALGFEYTPKPYFKLRLSPMAPRLTVVQNKELYLNVDNNYGVPVGETTRLEWLAFQLLADFDKDLNENVNLKFRYMTYANYETLELNKIDHRLDAILSAKIAKYFEVQLSGTLLYDFDQDDSIQLSQALGIGFMYSMRNYTDK